VAESAPRPTSAKATQETHVGVQTLVTSFSPISSRFATRLGFKLRKGLLSFAPRMACWASVNGSRKEKIVLSFFSSPTKKFQSKLTLLARGLPPLRTTKQGQRPHSCDGLA